MIQIFIKDSINIYLQELRAEDYVANRKGKQAGAAGGFGFAVSSSNSVRGEAPAAGALTVIRILRKVYFRVFEM